MSEFEDVRRTEEEMKRAVQEQEDEELRFQSDVKNIDKNMKAARDVASRTPPV